jgi:hydrogenase nickel incorporation protein HypA/HybF
LLFGVGVAIGIGVGLDQKPKTDPDTDSDSNPEKDGAQIWYSLFLFRCEMHELGIAQNILEIVRQSVLKEQIEAVRGIKVRVGQLSGVVPDSLDFCFKAIVSNTDLQQASLAIERVPTTSVCRNCMHRFQVEEFDFICPACQSTNLELISGKELEIVEIELADENDEDL